MFPSFNPGIISISDNATGQVPKLKNESTSRQEDSDRFGKFFDGLLLFTRIWGLLSAIVLAGVGVDLAFHGHDAGIYLTGGAVFILLAETTWVITLFMRLCVRRDKKVWKWWCAITWFSGWKKSLVYGPLGTIPIIWPHNLWLSYVAGGQILALAYLHLILCLKSRRKKRRKHRLCHNETESIESSKFEEVTECLDDELPEPIPGSSHSISDSLAEQNNVLEI